MVSIGTLILTGWGVSAQQSPPVDHVVGLSPGEEPHHEGDPDELRRVTARDAERYAWNVTTDSERLVIEIRIASGTFDVERSGQIVPTFTVPEEHFPYFAEWSEPAVWQAEGADRVYNRSVEEDSDVLRLSLPGPTNGRLALSTDTTPPIIVEGGATGINATGFTYRVRTDEPTRLEMAIRTGPDWNRTSASDLNAAHMVRMDRLRPETVYAVHIIVRDWAGNMGQHDDHITTRANMSALHLEPIRPTTDVEPDAEIIIEVRVRNMTAPLIEARGTLDGDPLPPPRERDDRLLFHPGMPPGPGPHIAHVQVTDADDKAADVTWTFFVPHTNATGRPLAVPGPVAPLCLAVVTIVAAALRRRRPL
ncbi:MAG: hypothetical protein KY455_00330 [Euryarchaeota archaeon]|nr:hypothetical protein [Euryarchaeota archaeon]